MPIFFSYLQYKIWFDNMKADIMTMGINRLQGQGL